MRTVFDEILLPFILLAVVQFPIYGILLGRANEQERAGRTAVVLLAVHAAAVLAVLVFGSENFS